MEYNNGYLQRYYDAVTAKGKAESALRKAKDDIWYAFTDKKDWKLFLKRHGLDLEKVNCNCHDWDFFFDDDIMRIRLEDYFRGEYDYYATDDFKISEFCDFMNSDDYYGPIMRRLESLKAVWDKQQAKEDKERRRQLYEKLKKEFEN